MANTSYSVPLVASGAERQRNDAWRQYRRALSEANAGIDRTNLQFYSPDADYGILSGINRSARYASGGQGFGGSGRIAQLKARPQFLKAGDQYMNAMQNLYGQKQDASWGLNETTARTAMRAADLGAENPSWSIDPSTAAIIRAARQRFGIRLQGGM